MSKRTTIPYAPSKIYIFASLRGSDFETEGDDPLGAWYSLVDREKDNGTLWRCHDERRNRFAVEREGFTPFDPNDLTQPVWKLKP